MLMTVLTKFRIKKHLNNFENTLDQMKSRNYKHKKERLKMSWNDALLKLNLPHANDYDIYDEVA
tara:strand:- start:522 stop:713 length:192 start_codon:yes stop_codon:yes gene_type:complete